jgi:hypothetical protein
MAPPTDPAATPSKATVEDASHLEQPSDAVPMASLPQSQSDPSSTDQPSAADDANQAAPSVAPEPSSSAAIPADSDKPADDTSAPSSSKGKEKSDDPKAPAPVRKDRSDSIMAIGPAQDDINPMTPAVADGPVCQITLLLTTGTRHPYKIDARYLNRRNVPMPEETEAGQPDPFSISIYTLKELILREWRTDWEAKPASPSSIRLIHFGKLLDDKEPLKSM